MIGSTQTAKAGKRRVRMETRKVAAAFGAILASTMLIVTLTPTLAAGPRAGYFTIRATGSYETGSNPMVQSIFVRYANWTAQGFRIDNSFMSYPYGPSPTFYLSFGYFSTKAIATELEGYRIVKGTFDATARGVSGKVSGAPFGDLEMVSAASGTVHVDFQRPIEDDPQRGEFAWITGRAKGNVRVVIPLGDATPPIGFGDWIYFGPEYTFEMVLVEPRYEVYWCAGPELSDGDLGTELTVYIQRPTEGTAEETVWVHIYWDAAEVDWKNGVRLKYELEHASISGEGAIPLKVEQSQSVCEDPRWKRDSSDLDGYDWYGIPPAPCRISLEVQVHRDTAPGQYQFVVWAQDDYSEKLYPSENEPLMLTVDVSLPQPP